jgi:hypothetical protein
MSSTILADRDVNATAPQQPAIQKADVKSLEYHRQVLQSKLDEEQYVLSHHASDAVGSSRLTPTSGKQQYVSPSDNIMSPCTAKLSAYRSKHVLK